MSAESSDRSHPTDSPGERANGSSSRSDKRAARSAGGDASRADGSGTLELPLLDLPSKHPCHRCGECCEYVAVEIDKPTAFADFDHIFWYLTHRSVSVYVDWEGEWFIEFATPCEHITPGRTCGIYEDRPKICSSFSWEECEKNTQEKAYKHRFEKPEEFFDFLLEKRPKAFERYAKQRQKMLQERTKLRKRKTPVATLGGTA